MKTTSVWRKEASRSLPNLEVLNVDGRDVGIIMKPNATGGDKAAWQSFRGIGDASKFVGHSWSKAGAKAIVEKAA